MRLALVAIGLLLVPIGIALWVQAGTRHMDSLPQTAELTSGGSPVDGPDRVPAQLAWAGATLCLIAAVAYRGRD